MPVKEEAMVLGKKMNTEEKVGQVLEFVCEMSGEPELPVRLSFELAVSLQRFFAKLEERTEGEGHERP
ncbi:MAG: hypothetical protein AAF975_08595 [Spirochaetota bacterium]